MDVSSLPPGVQPHAGGRLVCRYCGRPYAKLSQHLRLAYGISPDEYREQFELPATLPLMADYLREAIGARSRERLRTDPAVREALQLDVPVSAEREQRAARGRRRAQETATRAGVQRSWQALGEQAGDRSRARAQQTRADLDELARRRGHGDFGGLLRSTADRSARSLGVELGLSTGAVQRYRAEHSVKSTSRAPEALQAARRDRLAAVPAGVQPVEGGRLLCLEPDCARWYADLAQHLRRGHQLLPEQYRRGHQLPDDCPLVSDERRQRQVQVAAANSSRAPQALRAARRDRLAAVPAGVQPVEGGRLLCLEPDCARWYADLAQHLRRGHQLLPEQYRRGHQLPDDCPLVSDERRQRQVQVAAAKSSRAASISAEVRRAAARKRYDEQARDLGDYDGIVELFTAHTDDRVAGRLLGLTRDQVWRLRRRYASPPSR